MGDPQTASRTVGCCRAPHPQKEKAATTSTAVLCAWVLSCTAVSLSGPAGWPTGRLSFFSPNLLLPPLWGHFLRGWPEHGLQEGGVLQLRHSAAVWHLPLSQFPLLQLSPGPPAPIDMVSTSLGSQRLIGGGLRDFPFITMGFSACANKMPIRIFIF